MDQEFLIELWRNQMGVSVFVADPRTNNDDWRTVQIEKAKTWKEAKWARRWLRARPELLDVANVREVTAEERRSRR